MNVNPRPFGLRVLAAILICVPLNLPGMAQEYRTWTSNDGKFKTEAILTGSQSDRVTLKKKDGNKVEMAKARLSKADQDYMLTVTEQVKEAIRLADTTRQSLSKAARDIRVSQTRSLNGSAWRYCTSPDAEMFYPVALKQAEVAVEFCESEQRAMHLDTLACAQAANGNFAGAVQTLEMAIADPSGKPYLAEFKSRLPLFQKKQPYHEPVIAKTTKTIDGIASDGHSFRLINSTSTSLRAVLINVESTGQKLSYNSAWELEPGDWIDIAPKSNGKSIPSEAVTFDLHSRFGECMWRVQFDKSSNRQAKIQPQDLPLIHKQSEFRTWSSRDGKFTCKAKLAQHFTEKGIDRIQLLKNDGQLISLDLGKLHLADIKFIESIESGENPIVWAVGGQFIYPQHLIGKDVTIVMRWRHYSEIFQRVEPEIIYGPIFTGKIVDARTKTVTRKDSRGRRHNEKESEIQVNGEVRVFLVGVLGNKEKSIATKNQWMTVRSDGIMKYNIDFTQAAIDSILVDGHIYVQSNQQKFVLGSTDFWRQLKEKEPIRVHSTSAEKEGEMARGLIGFATVLGALTIGAGTLGGTADAPPMKYAFEINGRTLPNTKVYYGSGIGTYNSTVSDKLGNYRIFSLVRPMKDSIYYLDIEIAGKRHQKWKGVLNPNGSNRIDL